MIDIEILRSAANELNELIKDRNHRLRMDVICSDLDEPEYHDSQTCQELFELANRLEQKLKKGDTVATLV